MTKPNFMIIPFALTIILILFMLVHTTGTQVGYTYPGEFEKQQAVWLQWPEGQYVSAYQSVLPAFMAIVKALESHIRVNLISNGAAEVAQISNMLEKNNISIKNIHFYIVDHFSIWARDVGPVFVRDSSSRLSVVDFGFNNYGKGASQNFIDVESNIHRVVAKQLSLPMIGTSLVSEGGAIESNGQGTIMTTEAVAFNRNPTMTKGQIENDYKIALGLKKVIWLKQGLAEDDLITKGHVDEIARFANPTTILLAQVLPDDIYTNQTSYSSYLRMEENYNILAHSTDQNGKPFRIIRIPMPPTMYAETDITGKIPVRSYLNHLVTNKAVLIPKYWKAGRSDKLKATEAQVADTFKALFPGREIISTNVESINFWGGGIHCITQQMPAT